MTHELPRSEFRLRRLRGRRPRGQSWRTAVPVEDIHVVFRLLVFRDDQIEPQLEQEWRGHSAQELPSNRAVSRIAQVQIDPGPRDADEEQPAFLFELVTIAVAPLVREQRVLEADDEDMVEFEPLGGVERHQGRPLARRLIGVGIAEQRDLLEVIQQRRLGRLLVVGGGRIDQFSDVLQRVLTVLAGPLERLLQAGLAEDAFGQRRDRPDDVSPELVQQAGKGQQFGPRRPAHLRNLVGPSQRLRQGQSVADGKGLDAVHSDFADSPRRGVDDPQQRDLVSRIGQHLQVSQQVANFLAIVELHASDDLVRNATPNECFFEGPAHRVDPIEDRDLPGGHLLRKQCIDLSRHGIGLGRLVFVALHGNVALVSPDRDEGLLLAIRVAGDQAVGRPENGGGAAEVLFELDDHRLGPVLLEGQDVADVGAAPAIDRLVGIAGGADIAVGQRQGLGQAILRVVGVLVLIDEQELEPIGQLAADSRVVLQQKRDLHQQVVEIQSVALGEDLLVARVDLGQGPREEVLSPFLKRFRVDQLVLQSGDGVEHTGRREVRSVEAAILDRLLDALALVGRVIDAEIRANPGGFGVATENAHAQRMERADVGPAGRSEGGGPLAHLLGGLVRKGDRADVVRPDAGIDQRGDAARDDPRLSTARSGQDQQRAVPVRDRLALRRRQLCQKCLIHARYRVILTAFPAPAFASTVFRSVPVDRTTQASPPECGSTGPAERSRDRRRC